MLHIEVVVLYVLSRTIISFVRMVHVRSNTTMEDLKFEKKNPALSIGYSIFKQDIKINLKALVSCTTTVVSCCTADKDLTLVCDLLATSKCLFISYLDTLSNEYQ